MTVEEAYITESIREPGAKVREGFQPIMPVFDFSDRQIADLIAFMRTLD